MTHSGNLKRLLLLSAAAGVILLFFATGSAPVILVSTVSVPANSVSNDSVPVNSASNDSAPVDSVSTNSATFNSVSNDSAPVDPVSNEFVPAFESAGGIDAYVIASARQIDPKVAGAINKIEGTPRRVLALRGYLRSRNALREKWSWDSDEIARYKQSAEYRAALSEIEKIKAKFAEQNPGYSIDVNTEVRTLEAQIASWNRTPSVATAADDLFAAVQNELAKQTYSERPDDAGLRDFQNFLLNQKLSVAPTVATPGLSAHGQLRAFDFRISKDGQVIATTDSSTVKSVWDGQGWTQKLNTAIKSASPKFTGPLAEPREPWHYTYTP